MSFVLRLLTAMSIGGAAMALAPTAAADPDTGKSADAVITQLQKQGYDVQVNGRPAGDVTMLTTCTVTSVDHPDGAPSDPGTTTTVNVAVACPMTHS